MKKSFFLSLTLGVLFLSSCFKAPKPDPVGDAYVKAVNTVKGSNSQEFYLNGTKRNAAAIPYGEATPYITVSSGSSQFAFADAGTVSGTANAATQLVGVPIGVYATTFYIKVKNQTTLEESLMATIINDDMKPSLVAGKAKVRFIHLNYLLNNSISVMSGTSSLLTGIPFGSASSYIDVDPGTKFTFKATDVTTSPEIGGNFLANKNYTIWVDGASATELTGHIIAQ
ncbi:DUF4397 domain-containing protein [Pedobacter foliorum]|uniref:DUF4397 domain-containing protein n=1 Tax=Pedobacter foliorum TaxID=2739058 RepID=UPI0015676C32|nr:DUF4397 domain-containing protein [Pedobacter foliorum]NRF40984.1 DUF4397 domain-containing protein [Pedobacter foliorum]